MLDEKSSDPRFANPQVIDGCRARLADPSYTRHDQRNTTLVLQHLRAYDEVVEILIKEFESSNEIVRATANRAAEELFAVLEYDEVLSSFYLRCLPHRLI